LFNTLGAKMAKVATKTRVTKKQVIAHRTRAVKDHSPTWEGTESLSTDEFSKKFRSAMDYYRLEFNGKDLKPAVIKWMTSVGCTAQDISAFKKTKDSRCGGTMGAIASCLLRGMPAVRADFNDGRDTSAWLRAEIVRVIEAGKHDIEDEEVKEAKPVVVQPSIQDRLRETAYKMTEEIESALEQWNVDPESFDPKAFKVINVLKGYDAKAAHARVIREFYQTSLNELLELAGSNPDAQLIEGYSHRSRKQVRKLLDFLTEVNEACTMLMQEAKVNRAPRAKKAQPKEKVVAKLKYMKTNEPLKLVSINPTDIIGSKELWVFNTKTRKLGKYIANEYMELGVKGTTITGFNETTSVQKTIRKPEEKLKEFKAAGKVQLRKFLEDINATDTKMNGRINEETILLKAV
jgi:hypothetical protein